MRLQACDTVVSHAPYPIDLHRRTGMLKKQHKQVFELFALCDGKMARGELKNRLLGLPHLVFDHRSNRRYAPGKIMLKKRFQRSFSHRKRDAVGLIQFSEEFEHPLRADDTKAGYGRQSYLHLRIPHSDDTHISA